MPDLPSLAELVARLDPISGYPAVAGAVIATVLLLIVADWRWFLFALELLYVALALISTRLLPPEWALLNLIVGGLIGIMWYLTARQVRWGRPWLLPLAAARQAPLRTGERWPALTTTMPFRIIVVLTVALVFLLGNAYVPLPGLLPQAAFLCLWLTVMGVLILALEGEQLKAGAGLLLWLCAVQLFYSNLTRDARMIGVLGALQLLVGLACAYLATVQGQARAAGAAAQDEDGWQA